MGGGGFKEKLKINRSRGRTGYNWRHTLSDFAAISGVLAGFCVTFIALILGLPATDPFQISFGSISVLFFGISAALFISAAEDFLRAKDFDRYDITEERLTRLSKKVKDWKLKKRDHKFKIVYFEKRGRICYNTAIYGVFLGLFFVIFPYNCVISLIVGILGIFLESIQLFKKLGYQVEEKKSGIEESEDFKQILEDGHLNQDKLKEEIKRVKKAFDGLISEKGTLYIIAMERNIKLRSKLIPIAKSKKVQTKGVSTKKVPARKPPAKNSPAKKEGK